MDLLVGLKPNLEGLKELRRRLLVGDVHSVFLYGSPFWARTLENSPRKVEALFRVQQRATLRTVSAYRTVFGVAARVLASLPPAVLLVVERVTGHGI